MRKEDWENSLMNIRLKSPDIQIASILYGVVTILSALLAVDPDEFTLRNVSWGGTAVGLAAAFTYCFKEIVHEEADRGILLNSSGYLRVLVLSTPVLAFPLASTAFAVVCLALGGSPSAIIFWIFILGIGSVAVVAFSSSYLISKNIAAAIFRALLWVGLCLLLYLLNKEA